MKTIKIDAKGKVLGRLASQIAQQLRGKDTPQFRPDRAPEVTIHVSNVHQMKITGRKRDQKMYHRHTGYPSGIRSRSLGEQMDRFPERVLITAVRGMLPVNRLRPRMLKRLIIEKPDAN